jgi:hypothetical protein
VFPAHVSGCESVRSISGGNREIKPLRGARCSASVPAGDDCGLCGAERVPLAEKLVELMAQSYLDGKHAWGRARQSGARVSHIHRFM